MNKIEYKLITFLNLNPDQLYELRIEVFVVEQTCIYQDLDGKDKHGFHLLGYTQGEHPKLVSYARLLPQNVSYDHYVSIGRVIVDKSIRQSKEGYVLMKNAIKYCEELWPLKSIKISAQAHLLKFYSNCGFVPVGDIYLEDDIPHIGMVLNK